MWRRSVDAMQQTQGDLAAARARAAAAEDAEKKKAEEADLGGAESVSETVGQVFAGYQCGSVTVRALDRYRLLRRAPVPSRPTFPAPRTPREPRVGRGGAQQIRPLSFSNRSSADASPALALAPPPPLLSQRGIEHPGDIAEAASLASISLPPATYPLYDALGADIVDGGGLSKLQLEGVTYACQKHCERLADGARAGFMIGDGAGVGKGRQISGIVLDNYARGRRKHLWISSSGDLHRDAERDLRDLGCHLKVIDGCRELDRETRAAGLSRDFAEGVLFLTYATLVSRTSRGSRLEQIVEWFGGESADGCLLLDECHKAKNFNAGADAGSKVAACVIELQRRCPDARVVYCSATGISEIGNMAYMQRLGFWGRGTPFADADRFISAMRNRGVGFLEMLAMEMKASGKYVSRGLSFRQAEFATEEAALTREQTKSYNDAARFMAALRACTAEALVLTRRAGGKGQTWKAYWSLHQRFFKLLCVSMKVPVVVRRAREALAEGKCVVIGLQTTGESAETGLGLAPGAAVDGFASTVREMLVAFIRNHFPTRYEDVGVNDGGGGGGADDGWFDERGVWHVAPSSAPSTRGELAENAECVEARRILLAQAEDLNLPPNFLDELIDELGGTAAVAEMTGRRARVVRVAPPRGKGDARARGKTRANEPGSGSGPGTGAAEGDPGESGADVRLGARASGSTFRFESRAEPRATTGRAAAGSIANDGDVEGVNLREKAAFNRGDKLVAVISDAASTGISLHACRGAGNQRRRVHITIELPWSADKAIQQLGRTHRSNQTSGPLYVMCSTNLGGERRFAAAVARRLQSLGALTRGDRRAATGIDLSEGNLDSPLGRRALKKMYDALVLPGMSLANGVSLSSVLAHLPADADAGADWDPSDPTVAYRVRPPTAEELLRLEAVHPGAGAGILRDELRQLVVSLGVQVGLSPAGFAEETARALATNAAASAGGATKDAGDVRRFLNRILGLPVRGQNLLFGYFTEVLEAEVKAAKAEGKYSEGVSDLSGSNIRIESTETLVRDPFGGGAELRRTGVLIDRGVAFDAAVATYEAQRRLPKDGFYRMRRDMYGRAQVILALAKPGARNVFTVTRPNTGASFFEMELEELDQKYRRVPDDQLDGAAREAWETTYALTERGCMHGANCERGAACVAGSRAVRCCILSGAVVPAWGVLERVLERHEHRFNKSDRGMRAVKAVAEDGTKVVGIRYPEDLLSEVRERVAQEWAARDDQENADAAETAETEKAREKARDAAAVAKLDGTRRNEGVLPPSPGGAIGIGGARVRVEAPTPVDPKCVRRAMRAPKTMLTFFRKRSDDDEGSAARDETDRVGGGSQDDPIALDGTGTGTGDANGGGSSAEKRARVERDAGGDARGGKRAAAQTPFSFAPQSRADAGARGRGGGSRVERTTCFICQHVFPATALNTEINAHVDECMKTLA